MPQASITHSCNTTRTTFGGTVPYKVPYFKNIEKWEQVQKKTEMVRGMGNKSFDDRLVELHLSHRQGHRCAEDSLDHMGSYYRGQIFFEH